MLLVLLLTAVSVNTVRASGYEQQQALIDRATITFKSFVSDPNMTWFRDHLSTAKGLLIVPQLLKGAFIFGAEGGTGVLIARDQYTGKWSQPAFYTIASVSFGLQAGAQSSQIILMIMTDSGLDALLSTSIKLGADVSIAAGPYGAGAKAETVDILAFARSKGLFGGVSIEGAIITPKDSWNIAYYRKNVRPVDIIIRGIVYNPYSEKLIKAVTEACMASKKPAPAAPTTTPAPATAPEPDAPVEVGS
ncbi:MAG: lipid-binding SYLF domain-containing protein [Thermodesulfobacteria bacterium]|nr:lipid-binding SYLF domain-containing protein [Thermodesulfobacteriota bacterium]